MLGIVVTAALIYLAIGATLWALWLHPLDSARDIPLSIVTWPYIVFLIACWTAIWLREMRGFDADAEA